MPEKTLSYAELTPGYKFAPATYELNASFVSKYSRAVESIGDGFVPPLAITACAIAAMTRCVPVPAGIVAIHASQELEFLKLVPVGTTIECHIAVAQKIARGKMSMLVLELEVLDKDKRRVQVGKATIALPT